MRGICVHQKEEISRPDWIYDELCYVKEQAGSRVSVIVIRASHTADTQVSKRVFPRAALHTRQMHPNYCYAFLVIGHEDSLPPLSLIHI